MALTGYAHIIVYIAEAGEKGSMIALTKCVLQVGVKDFP